MIGFLPGTTPASLYDDLKTLAAPAVTFFSGGKYAPRSKAMDQNLKDSIMSQYDKTGIMSGVLGYSDFDKSQTPGTAFPDLPLMSSNLFSGKVSPAQFSNAMTGGRLTYDINPDTGKVTLGSNKYNFDPANAVIDPSENLAQQAFSYFAGKANERNREINPDISIPVDYLRGFGRDFSQFDQAKMGQTQNQNQSIAKENDLMDYDEFYDMPEEKEKEGIFATLKDKINPANLLSFLANVYTGGTKQALTGAGIGKALGNVRGAIGNRLGPAPYGTSQAAFNAMTPSQQRAVGSIYGQGGIMQGYNAVSAFGRGPAGAIQNRIDNILGRKAAGKKFSAKNLAALQAAAGQVGGGGSGSSADEATGGTFGSSVNDASTFSDYS